MRTIFILALVLACTFSFTIKEQTQNKQSGIILTPLTLGQPVYATRQSNSELDYYTLSLNSTEMAANEVLLLSVVSSVRTFVSVYINIVDYSKKPITEDQLPTLSNSSAKCSNFNVMTCPILNPTTGTTVVIGVMMRDPVQFTIVINKNMPQNLQLGQTNIKVSFDNEYAKVYTVTLPSTNSNTEVVLNVQYNTQMAISNQPGIFTISCGTPLLGSITVPIQQQSYSLTAYSQQLKLTPQAMPYYITITAQKSVSLQLSLSTPNSTLVLSEPKVYLFDMETSLQVNQITQFIYTLPSNSQNMDGVIDYGVYVQKYRGTGKVTVTACDFKYQVNNTLGYTTYVIIPSSLLTCTLPSITITLSNIVSQYGLSMLIQPYQQDISSTQQTLFKSEQIVHALGAHTIPSGCWNVSMITTHDTEVAQNFILSYSGNAPTMNLTVNKCKLDDNRNIVSCNPLQFTFKPIQTNYLFLSSQTELNYLTVCSQPFAKNAIIPTTPMYYSLLLLPMPALRTAYALNDDQGTDTVSLDVVNADQQLVYIFRNVTYNKTKTNSTLQTRVKLLNGDILFYQKCTSFLLNIEQACSNVDSDQAWHYSASYKLSELDDATLFNGISFGVRGMAQSLYQIYGYIDDNSQDPVPPGPTPHPDPSLLYDGINNITVLPNQSVSIAYYSHIIPYTVNLPSNRSGFCIEWFSSQKQLQDTQVCSQNSNKLQAKQYRQKALFIRVSNIQKTTNNTNNTTSLQNSLLITIDLPKLTISQDDQYLAISCNDACYTTVTVTDFDFSQSEDGQNVVAISGNGFINDTQGRKDKILKFDKVPFSFTAFIQDAGDLYIQIGAQGPYVVTSQKSNLQMDYFNDLLVIVPVNGLSTLLVNSFGRKFSASWTLYILNNSQSSTQKYSYPIQTDMYTPDLYSPSSVPVLLSSTKQTELSPLCHWSSDLLCFFAVHLSNAQQNLDILNDDSQIQISSNSTLDILYLNVPEIVQFGYGVIYHSVILLKVDFENGRKISNQFQVYANKTTIQPLSACGTLSADLLLSSPTYNSQQKLDEQYVQVYATEPCVYSVAISYCQLPMMFSGVPKSLIVNMSEGYSTLFYPPTTSENFQISLWLNYSNSVQSSNIIVNVYEIVDSDNDCSAAKNKLIKTASVGASSEQPVYKGSNSQNTIKIPIDQTSPTNLYLIVISSPTAVSSTSCQCHFLLNMLITTQKSSLVLLPSSNSIPLSPVLFTTASPFLPGSMDSVVYDYYSDSSQWQFCYLNIDHTDTNYKIGVQIKDQSGVITTTKSTKMNNTDQTCYTINRRQFNSILTKYSITIMGIMSTRLPSPSNLWLRTTQYIQSIQINHPFNPVIQQQQQLLTFFVPNGNIGYCYSFDINNIRSTINIVFYLQQPHRKINGETNPIHVPGNKLQYNYTEIQSTRTGKITAYKVQIKADQAGDNDVVVCYNNYGQNGFITKAVDQTGNFQVIFNQEKKYRQVQGSDSTVLQAYKFVDFNFDGPVSSQTKRYLVTEVVACDMNSSTANVTLLGAKSLLQIIMGNIAEFDKVINKNPVLAAMNGLNNSDQFFVGLKHQGLDNLNYSITTYLTNSSILPQSRWSISPKLSLTQSQDKQHLIVQMLPVTNTTVIPSNVTLNYTVFVFSNNNSTMRSLLFSMVRCPANKAQLLSKFKNVIPVVFNNSLINPAIPIFKIKVGDLPSNNITVAAMVQIIDKDDHVMPIHYYYNTEAMIVQGAGPQPTEPTKKFNMIVLFFILGIATFLVILFRVIYKIVRRRMRANDVQFEMSDHNRAQPSPAADNTAAVTTSPNRQSARDNVGYGEFVEEQVSV